MLMILDIIITNVTINAYFQKSTKIIEYFIKALNYINVHIN